MKLLIAQIAYLHFLHLDLQAHQKASFTQLVDIYSTQKSHVKINLELTKNQLY